ncbi:MAG: shikimate kinase [Desulfobulbaceae bacterium]|nr:shikimate kinase [Desulfobulbaceae bacterium]
MNIDLKHFSTSRPVRIVLTGFRATGKTSVGKVLASDIGYVFIDTDQELVNRMGCSIADYVGEHGWEAFRDLERSLLSELCFRTDLVIATGGGAITHGEQWRLLAKDSMVVWLKADARTICARMSVDVNTVGQRPSLTGADILEEVVTLLDQRNPLYRDGSHMALDTGEMTLEAIVDCIKENWYLVTGLVTR